jgi:hypothetical protein
MKFYIYGSERQLLYIYCHSRKEPEPMETCMHVLCAWHGICYGRSRCRRSITPFGHLISVHANVEISCLYKGKRKKRKKEERDAYCKHAWERPACMHSTVLQQSSHAWTTEGRRGGRGYNLRTPTGSLYTVHFNTIEQDKSTTHRSQSHAASQPEKADPAGGSIDMLARQVTCVHATPPSS